MIAFDTNILIYAYDDSSPVKRERSRELLTTVRDGVLLWQVACEFVAASRKTLPPGSDQALAWARLSEIRGVLPLIVPEVKVLDQAARIHTGSRAHLWDCLIFAACLEHGVSTLFSEDVPGSHIDGLTIKNPYI